MKRWLGRLSARRVLVGVQPERVDWGMALSPSVAAALPAALEAAAGILRRWTDADPG